MLLFLYKKKKIIKIKEICVLWLKLCLRGEESLFQQHECMQIAAVQTNIVNQLLLDLQNQFEKLLYVQLQ